MDTLATLLAATIAQLQQAILRLVAREPARMPILDLTAARLARIAARFQSLFARFQAGTLPSQTGAPPRPSRAGQPRPSPAKPPADLPRGHGWLLRASETQRPAVAAARSLVQHILARPELPEFLAAAPQAGRLLRPLCRMLAIPASPDVPAALALPSPPRFRPAPPPPPPRLGIIDPPEVPPLHRGFARSRAGLAWYQ
ncbi:MAG: hypothetical protein IT555_13035 [Acetobacteraceae bacterium]|nr:hypothetical protein [Acetobacteraceae bacterium]